MKKLNKKGFTIIELVIVIAVIAILAAVLIPTFSSVIKNANQSSAMQACTAAYTEALADAYGSGTIDTTKDYESNGWKFRFTAANGAVTDVTVLEAPAKYAEFSYEYANNSWTAAEKGKSGYDQPTPSSGS